MKLVNLFKHECKYKLEEVIKEENPKCYKCGKSLKDVYRDIESYDQDMYDLLWGKK